MPPKSDDSPLAGQRLGDVKAVAAKLNCSARHVYRLAKSGSIPKPIRLGVLIRWNLEQLDAWIADGCKPVAASKIKKGGSNE